VRSSTISNPEGITWGGVGAVKHFPPLRRRSELDRLVDLIRSETSGIQDAWLSSDVKRVGTAEYESYLLTLSAAQHIQNRLSVGRYWTLDKHGRAPSGTEACLRFAAGICGNHVQAMVDVMRKLGCVTRPIGFYFNGTFGTAASHSAVEVAWSGRWHYVDVTNGAVFRSNKPAAPDLLSIAEILSTRDPLGLAILNGSKPEFQMTSEIVGHPLDYLTSDPDVVVDGEGAVRLRALKNGDRMRFQLDSLPAYLGSVPASTGGYGWLRLLLLIDEPVDSLEMLVTEVTNLAGVVGTLCVHSDLGDWEATITAEISKVELPVHANGGHVELSIKAPAERPCCVVFKSLSLRRAQGASPIFG
jgi:transglutaminase superfamily protein